MTGVGGNAWLNAWPNVKRPEVVFEVFLEGKGKEEPVGTWVELDFRYKPTSLNKRPLMMAPHQPRLDWQLWFAALASYQSNPWLVNLCSKLLDGDNTEVLQLLPPDAPVRSVTPSAVRATLYDYDFTRLNSSWARENPHAVIASAGSNWPYTPLSSRVDECYGSVASSDFQQPLSFLCWTYSLKSQPWHAWMFDQENVFSISASVLVVMFVSLVNDWVVLF